MRDSPTVTRRGAVAAISSILAPGAFAQSDKFPSRPIRLIVPFSPGGFTDASARVVATKMGEKLGVPVTVDNRPGANGVIGASIAATAPADGYTILQGHSGVFSVNAFLYPKMQYDPERDFVPLTLMARTDLFLVVNPQLLRAQNFVQLRQELSRLDESSPLRTYASVGSGSTHHLGMELLKRRTGLNLRHIPYKGSSPALQDLLGGQVPMMLSAQSAIDPFVKQGRLRVIAIARASRATDHPNTPTFAEQGIPGFDVWGWLALAVHAQTPPSIRETLRNAYVAGMQDAEARRRLSEMDADMLVTTPTAALEHFRAERALWGDVIKSAGITLSE